MGSDSAATVPPASAPRKQKSKARSKITNGTRQFIENPTAKRLTRRFTDLLTASDDPQVQLDQLRRTLCLAAEQLEACAARGEPYDVALFCNITGQIARTLDRITELTKPAAEPVPDKKPYWEPAFHAMSDEAFDQWVQERGVTSDACADEVRARAHIADLKARGQWMREWPTPTQEEREQALAEHRALHGVPAHIGVVSSSSQNILGDARQGQGGDGVHALRLESLEALLK